MPHQITPDGWFTTIGDRQVIKNDLTRLSHTSFNPGMPNGLVWHYTSSCNDDTSAGIISRGYLTHAFAVGRDGSIRQYAPLFVAAWHAFDVSHYKVGVEHTAEPGTCDLTDTQLQASAELFAAIILEIKAQHGVDVPLVHVLGCDYLSPGLKEHKDGVGCAWDPNTHTDGLYSWGWPKYLAAIDAAIKEDDMAILTDDQQKYLQGALRVLNQTGPPPADADPKIIEGFNETKARFDYAAANPKPTNNGGVSQDAFNKHYHDSANKTSPPRLVP